MSAVLLTGRGGLGDAIYARPFVREAVRRFGDVYVSTSWPEMFADLPVRPVKRLGGLAVQAYHGELAPAERWAEPPAGARQVTLRYRWAKLAARFSVLAEMEALSGLRPRPLRLDLPPLPEPPLSGPYAVVRPPAVRVDYPAPSREPDPAYLRAAAEALLARGLRVVTIGAWVPGLEEPNGPELPASVRFEYGELPLMRAVSLVAHAAVVVSAPCWLVPASAAARTPAVVIAGGCGGRNNPDALVDRRLRAPINWLLPDGYCLCRRRDHACPKAIPDFGAKLARALDGACARRAA